MNLKEIQESDREWLWASDIAEILKCNPQSIRSADPRTLGYKVSKQGNRTRISRKSFLSWLEEQ